MERKGEGELDRQEGRESEQETRAAEGRQSNLGQLDVGVRPSDGDGSRSVRAFGLLGSVNENLALGDSRHLSDALTTAA